MFQNCDMISSFYMLIYNLLNTKHAAVELFETNIYTDCVKCKISEPDQCKIKKNDIYKT